MNSLDHLFGPQSLADQVETGTFVLLSRFLQLVEQVMDDRGMTRRELAMKIGTSPSYVTQLFRGHKTANLETLAKIELALGIEFEVQIVGVAAVEEDIDQQAQAPKTAMDGQTSSYFSEHLPNVGEYVYNQSA